MNLSSPAELVPASRRPTTRSLSKHEVLTFSYFETELLDFRRADKIYRTGLSYLKGQDEALKKELGNLSSLYSRFSDRILKRIESEGLKEVNQVKRNGRCREREDFKKVTAINESVYGNKRHSFTKNQVILGGIPIFVDEEFRPDVIPTGTQNVERFYDVLNEIDYY